MSFLRARSTQDPTYKLSASSRARARVPITPNHVVGLMGGRGACACEGNCPSCSRESDSQPASSKPGDTGAGTTALPTPRGPTPMGGGGGGSASATKTVDIDTVKLRNSNRDPAADVNFANTVFKPANVQFKVVKNEPATVADSDKWLGGDTTISSGTCGSATQEELDAWNGCVSTFKFSSRLRAFYAEALSTKSRADSYPPYCATGTAAPLSGMASVSNDGANRSLAHELGHILTNLPDHPADTNNLMHPTNTATGEVLTTAQRTTIYANA